MHLYGFQEENIRPIFELSSDALYETVISEGIYGVAQVQIARKQLLKELKIRTTYDQQFLKST